MRHLRRRQSARAQGFGLTREVDIPLPLKGVYFHDNETRMAPAYAALLTNWESNGFDLCTVWPVELTAMTDDATYAVPFDLTGTGNEKIVYLSATRLTDGSATYSRAVTGPPTAAYLSNHAVIAAPGAAPVLYDGSAFTALAVTGIANMASVDGAVAHQGRLFLWKRNTAINFWYGGIGAISGAVTEFPLRNLGNISGKIAEMVSFSVDAGDGMNDLLAIFTTTGWVVLYQGNDPGDAANWAQVQRIKLSPPAGVNCVTQVGPDVWVLTAAGLVSLSDSIRLGRMALVNNVSRPIASEIAEELQGNKEWQLHTSVDGRKVIVNILNRFVGSSRQLVLDVESQSWSDWQSRSEAWHWFNVGTETRFTTEGATYGVLGEPRQGSVQNFVATIRTPWFGLGGRRRIAYIEPVIIASAPVSLTLSVMADHDESPDAEFAATQQITLNMAGSGGATRLSEKIPVGITGDVFRIMMQLQNANVRLVGWKAGVE